jgi:hypothetical protein
MDRYITYFRVVFQGIIQHKYFLPGCFMAAFVIRLAWITLVNVPPVSDFRWYYHRGIDLAGGQGYTVEPNSYWPENLIPPTLAPVDEAPGQRRATAYWPVGYPAFLGLLFRIFGASLGMAKVANVFLYMGILFFVYHIAKTLFASKLTAKITLLILTFYPDHIVYTSLLASEILFLFLLLLAIMLLLIPKYKWGLAGLSGVIFGLACLVRPQALFVPTIFFAILLAQHFKQKPFSQYLALMSLVHLFLGLTILPWSIRNYIAFNDFIFISNNSGFNLLIGNNPAATGRYDVTHELTATLKGIYGEHERDQKAFELALDYMVEHPLDTIRLWPKKLWYLYAKDIRGIFWNQIGFGPSLSRLGKAGFYLLKIIAQLYYTFVGGLFLFALFTLYKRKNKMQPIATVGLWLVLYFTAISLITFGDSRFHFPMMPWLVMYSSAALSIWLTSVESQTEILVGQTVGELV